jgi:3-methylcrotonyl-CoA carboxylase alpha subunit
VPVVPGYRGEEQDAKTLATEAKRIGFPVMIKAVAGGGGRGMRLVEAEKDLAGLLESAQREAQAAFGDGRVLIEKVVVKPRHIEVQVFGDSHGNVVHLYERDCSLQRRNQKVIEEAPAPGISPELRAKICNAAVTCAKAVGYEGAGTVEFLIEGGDLSAAAPWYFIEMNTRLQVEHPVTELITGLDLVEWQLRVASGEKLPLTQDKIKLAGHAIEARLCAENPAKGFIPSTGPIAVFESPELEGLRVDSGVEAGSEITPFYDSMIAKLIASGPDRATAIGRLAQALEETVVAGPKTNASFLHALAVHPAFNSAHMDTGLIGRELATLAPRGMNPRAIAFGITSLLWNAHDATEVQHPANAAFGYSPWGRQDAFQLGAPRRQQVKVLVDGVPTQAEVTWAEEGPSVSVKGADVQAAPVPRRLSSHGDGNPLYVICDMRQVALSWPTFDADAAADDGDGSSVRAPIIGRVAKVFVKAGDKVAKGDRVAVVEAMKMEHVLHAARDGIIDKVAAKEGDQVVTGALIASLGK